MKESDNLVDRLNIEHIENWLLNRGYRRFPTKPLSYTQISYLCWEMFRLKVTRQTIRKHFVICMGNPRKNIPFRFDSKTGKYFDDTGTEITKEEFMRYHSKR